MNTTTIKLSPSTTARIKTFVDWFIRSEYMQGFQSDRDSDFINEPDRAARCYDAAEFGCDGKTHAEVIEDWRDGFDAWIRDYRRVGWHEQPERFMAAVHARFDAVEQWHEQNGSLHEQIG